MASLPLMNTPTATRSPLRSIGKNDISRSITKDSSSHKRSKLDQNVAQDSAHDKTDTVDEDRVALCYPQDIPIPSRSLVRSLYEVAMTTPAKKESNDNDGVVDTDNDGDGDQQLLSEAGLLSLQQVLLPAIAYQEKEALKKWQSRVQRDHSAADTAAVLACRKLVHDSIAAAMKAASQSRQARRPLEAEREQVWAAEQASRLAQDQQQREQELLQHKRDLQKKLPRNQELYREQVYLMTELNKLQKEERLWSEAKDRLAAREQEILALEKERAHQLNENNTKVTKSNAVEDQANDSQIKSSTDMVQVEHFMHQITMSSDRIQQALQAISGIMTESERVRQNLYRRYKEDHQFHGYEGVKNVKDLVRALSQSQPDFD